MGKRSKYINDIYRDVAFDFYEKFGKKIDEDVVDYVIRDLFKTTRKLIRRGVPKFDYKMTERIVIHKLGSFILNRSKMIRTSLGGTKRVDGKEFYKNAKYLNRYGWQYFKWLRSNGFMFINGANGDIYCLREEGVQNLGQAYERFAEILSKLDNKVEINDNEAKEEPILGKIFKYDYDHKKVEEYDSIEEAKYKDMFDIDDIKEAIYHNRKYKNTRPHKIVGGYFFFDEETDKEVKDLKFGHRPRNTIVSIVNKKTKEVEYEAIGTVQEAIWFLRKTNKNYKYKSSSIYRVLDKEKTMYGYIWRTWRSGQSDRIEDGGDTKKD